MRGIEIAGPVAGQFAAPGQGAVPLEVETPAVVHVTAFGEGQLAEDALFDQVEDHHRMRPVAAVFGQHVDLAGLFGGPHQAPALVERHGRGHFAQHVLAGPQGVDRHHGMVLHGRGDQHGVQVVALEHSPVVGRAFTVPFRFRPRPGLLDHADCPIEMGLLDVANGGNLQARVQRQAQMMRAARPDADHADANRWLTFFPPCRGCQSGRQSGYRPKPEKIATPHAVFHRATSSFYGHVELPRSRNAGRINPCWVA